MKKIIQKLMGDPNDKALKRLKGLVDTVNGLEAEFEALSDEQLRAKTDEFRERLKGGETEDDIMPEAFAATREAAKRAIDHRHFDVQIMGGALMHEGAVAEMRTGEGKTLVATLPVYLNAISGKGVHLVTVNDFLAALQGAWMGQVFDRLGMTVGVIGGSHQAFVVDLDYVNETHDDVRMHPLKPASKKEAYRCDITYGTNNEFGFDYLRDNMRSKADDKAQRDLHFVIVDEVDSILIDEARTPLIISAPAAESNATYQQFAQIAKRFKAEHYTIDEKGRTATLTDAGVEFVEKDLGIGNLYETDSIELIYHLEQALRAETLFKLEKDYVEQDGEIIIVDEFTGRLLPGRRYNEGLHQAIEAKEGVTVQQESMTLATISFQNFFRLYGKLSGMTGTAKTEEEEFQDIYGLDVYVIPTNKPTARDDLADRIYKTEAGKMRAIAVEAAERSKAGQPVLIGTVSIEKNLLVSRLLGELGVKHQLLNGTNHEEEASIVAAAGQAGAITVATNIAGRGTDIKLGEGIVDKGGLHVIGSERHESRRIDNQLRGRSGRQGDAGSTQFYVSLDDDLMRIFGGERLTSIMNSLNIDEETPIENRMVSKSLEGAQKRVESHNYDIRKNVLQYDDVMNRHRTAIYERRQELLAAEESMRDKILDMVEEEAQDVVHRAKQAVANVEISPEDVDEPESLAAKELNPRLIANQIRNMVPIDDDSHNALASLPADEMPAAAREHAIALYDEREAKFGDETMRDIERMAYVQALDRQWMQHLESMQHLREGIGLQSVGQRNPLAEYKKAAFEMFEELHGSIDKEVAQRVFRIVPKSVIDEAVQTELTEAAAHAILHAPSEGAASTAGKSAKSSDAGNSTSTGNRTQRRRQARMNKKQNRR